MIVLIGLCGILGTLSRYALGQWIGLRGKTGKTDFPWGTWIANATGSLLLGVLFTLHANRIVSESLWLLAGTGFCGAYTTFSTFGLETGRLMLQGKRWLAVRYVLTSAAGGLICAYIGMLLPLHII